METLKRYDHFPLTTVLLSNLHSIMVYVLGLFIMYQISLIIAIVFFLYLITLEFRIIKTHCVDCYYFGKTCGFGKGRISALFFKKGDVSKFCSQPMTWKDMIPDMLVMLLPVLSGIVLIILHFNLFILLSIIGLVILATFGNSYIRGSLTCKYCKQKELGCPADQLFNKKTQ